MMALRHLCPLVYQSVSVVACFFLFLASLLLRTQQKLQYNGQWTEEVKQYEETHVKLLMPHKI